MINCVRLRQIKLNDNRLTIIPDEIALIPNVIKLDARQNRICDPRGTFVSFDEKLQLFHCGSEQPNVGIPNHIFFLI